MAENWNQEIERLRKELEAEQAKVAALRHSIRVYLDWPFWSSEEAMKQAMAATDNKEQ